MVFSEMAKDNNAKLSILEQQAQGAEASTNKAKAGVMDEVVDHLGGSPVPKLKEVQDMETPLSEASEEIIGMREDAEGEVLRAFESGPLDRLRERSHKFGRTVMRVFSRSPVEINTDAPAYKAIQEIEEHKRRAQIDPAAQQAEAVDGQKKRRFGAAA